MVTGAKEVGVFLGDVHGGKGLFDPVLGLFLVHVHFLQCFISILFSLISFFSTPITRDIQPCVPLLSFPFND